MFIRWFLLLCFPAISLGFTIFGEIFGYVAIFNPTIDLVTFHLCGWCMLGVFLLTAFTCLKTWTSGPFESMRWNACVHRLGLGLYSNLKEFGGMESEPMLTPREKSPLPENFYPEDQPTMLHHAGQWAQNTTNELFQPHQMVWLFTF